MVKDYRKAFIPLESNPDLFTELIHTLGVSTCLRFQDVLSLDDPELLAFIPRPVYALILVFPTTEAYEKQTDAEAEAESYQGSGEDKDVLFFKQTIHNACGLYALLHSVCNGTSRAHILPNSTLAQLIQDVTSLKQEERALNLEGNANIESSYASVASRGDTRAPDPEDQVDVHYISFVKSHKNNHFYRLDGDRKGPIDLGLCDEGDDVLSEQCLDIVREFIAKEKGERLHFNLMALVAEG